MASRIFLQYAQDVHGGFSRPVADHSRHVFQDPSRHRDPYALMTEFSQTAIRISSCRRSRARNPALLPAMRTKLEARGSGRRGRAYGRPDRRQPAPRRTPGRRWSVAQPADADEANLDRSATAGIRTRRLQAAVVAFQANNGINADGIAGDADDPRGEPLRSEESLRNEVCCSRWSGTAGPERRAGATTRLIYVQSLTDFHTGHRRGRGDLSSPLGDRLAPAPDPPSFSDEMRAVW